MPRFRLLPESIYLFDPVDGICMYVTVMVFVSFWRAYIYSLKLEIYKSKFGDCFRLLPESLYLFNMSEYVTKKKYGFRLLPECIYLFGNSKLAKGESFITFSSPYGAHKYILGREYAKCGSQIYPFSSPSGEHISILEALCSLIHMPPQFSSPSGVHISIRSGDCIHEC